MQYLEDHLLTNKRVLLRVDFNVSLNANYTIADDARIKQAVPTIQKLLSNHNKIILISHLGRPEGRDEKYSLTRVAADLQKYIPDVKIRVVTDFLTEASETFQNQSDNEILLLENIRYYKEESENDPQFAKRLAALADVYVNDAFSVSHRSDASIVGIPPLLPSYAGMLLKKEITMLEKATNNPHKPVVAILGGAKVSTKISLISKLLTIADTVLLGGGLATTLLAAQGFNVGNSLYEKEKVDEAKRLLALSQEKQTELILPTDIVVSKEKTHHTSEIKSIADIDEVDMILDLGPATLAKFGQRIATAKTVIWNGPVGYFENPSFKEGTDFIYYAITENSDAFSVVGGGETLAAISKKEYLEKISHISTGGGAMLEYIENGTLPGIAALEKA